MDRTYETDPRLRLIATAKKLEEFNIWLEACPSNDGQPYYETAHGELEELYEDAVQAAVELGNKDIEQTIRELIEDGPPRCRQEAEIWEFVKDEAEKLS